MAKYSVSVIIPNYNGRELLKKNLAKVVKATGENKEIKETVVVDDCSTDESVDFVKKNFPEVKVVVEKKNSGFSSTVNKGVKEAAGDIILLLNNDVFPKLDFLSPLLSHFADQNLFAVGCLQETREGNKVILRGRGIGGFRKGFLVHRRGEVNGKNTLWVSGGAGAFRKSIWQKLGGLDELYNPFYWEDIDLSYRALKAGYRIVFEPRSIVFHEQIEGAIRKGYSPFFIKTIAYRNQFTFFWKNISDLKLLFSHIFWFPYHFIRALVDMDISFFTGFFLALFRLPLILTSRMRASRYWQTCDTMVVAPFREEMGE